MKLDGVGNYLATEFEKSFTGKNITAEMWVLPAAQANQTVFSHGDQYEALELTLTSDNKMQMAINSFCLISPFEDFNQQEIISQFSAVFLAGYLLSHFV